MVKRSREPLADTNSVISAPVIDKGTNTFVGLLSTETCPVSLTTELQRRSLLLFISPFLPPSSTGVVQPFSLQAQVLRGESLACSR